MKQKILFILALLCAIAQGAWAQNFSVWDGHSEEKPGYNQTGDYRIAIYIYSANQLAWLMNHYLEAFSYADEWGNTKYAHPQTCDIVIQADIDMTAGNWQPLGWNTGSGGNVEYGYNYGRQYTFDGAGHTIKLKIQDATNNYQGLFYGISEYGTVRNLHVEADIHCSKSRLVGGITGENDGTIDNCWVSGTVRSDWHESGSSYTGKVGGIAGENNGTIRYCCVTADVQNDDADVGGIVGDNSGHTIEHCTFYGSVTSSHDQDSKYAGDKGTVNNCYDSFNQSEYDSDSSKDMYRKAVKYPFAINVTTAGPGTVEASAGGETGITRWHPGETVKLTVTSEREVAAVTLNAWTELSGNKTDGYTFTMPSGDTNVKVVFINEDGSIPDIDTAYGLEDGKTYRVTEDATVSRRLVVRGTSTLILGEGVTLRVPKGIELSADYNANLTIEGPGTLAIYDCDYNKSGIGAEKVGTLTINGGTINVTGGERAAGIGGDYENTVGGTIIINGGVVTANTERPFFSESGAAGIGGGETRDAVSWLREESGVCGDIVINGGQVTATGGEYGPGIGPGYESEGGETAYDSGTLTLGWSSPTDFLKCSGFKTDDSGI